ncbi:hypothetical protein MKW98_013563 [Papaver atlanticum]|uniref:Uncharacterized protein n=1 Tax=Papaver atlanticum TaxID=357466 RepID=A0AAD4XPS8_9MAGN|nr:hypothetical protein MKW98_013563 [Papaver atlanticum]
MYCCRRFFGRGYNEKTSIFSDLDDSCNFSKEVILASQISFRHVQFKLIISYLQGRGNKVSSNSIFFRVCMG